MDGHQQLCARRLCRRAALTAFQIGRAVGGHHRGKPPVLPQQLLQLSAGSGQIGGRLLLPLQLRLQQLPGIVGGGFVGAGLPQSGIGGVGIPGSLLLQPGQQVRPLDRDNRPLPAAAPAPASTDGN